jgi:hypothetical protein
MPRSAEKVTWGFMHGPEKASMGGVSFSTARSMRDAEESIFLNVNLRFI